MQPRELGGFGGEEQKEAAGIDDGGDDDLVLCEGAKRRATGKAGDAAKRRQRLLALKLIAKYLAR